METLLHDLRYGARTLRRAPGFTAAAVLTLALGIGANAIIFSFVDSIWLRPLPVPRAAEVVRVYTADPGGDGERGLSSYPDYLDVRAQAQTFSGLSALERRGAFFDNGRESKLVTAAVVSENFFSLLGVTPASGRIFTEAELRDPNALSVMVSQQFWRREFGSDPTLAGRTITLDNQQVHVAGVLPADFRASSRWLVCDVWVPMPTWDRMVHDQQRLQARGRRSFELYGRLAPGHSVSQANAEVGTIAARLAQQYPATNPPTNPATGAGRNMSVELESKAGSVESAKVGAMLLGIAALVLLIACANLASLLLARSEHRRKEMATRLALGATRARIVRQLLTESTLIAAAASAAGLLLAFELADVVPALLPQTSIPLSINPGVDARVALFAVACGLACVFLFGIAPAMQASGVNLMGGLNQRTATEGGSRAPLRSLLVVAQVALSLIMVVAASLLVRSVVRAYASDPGFNAHQEMLIADVVPGFGARTSQQAAAYVREARARVQRLPGVISTTASYRVPFGASYGGATRKVFLPGATGTAARQGITAHYTAVADHYFETLGTTIQRGRGIDEHDYTSQARVAVVNQRMAGNFWPGQQAIGQHMRLGAADGAEYEIIGIAEDGQYNELNESPMPYLFLPLPLDDQTEVAISIKSASSAVALAGPVREVLRAVDAGVPTIAFTTLHEHFAQSISDRRLTARLAGALGGLGLALAAMGLYGLMAFMVSHRTQEIGIRMALGAVPRQIFHMIMGRALWLTGAGIVAGCVGAFAATRALRTLLYGVTPTDVASYGIAVAVLVAVGLCAALVPALRATRLDPMQALRHE